jgi:serine/threonine protein kinase
LDGWTAFDPVLYKQIVEELSTLLRVAGRRKLSAHESAVHTDGSLPSSLPRDTSASIPEDPEDSDGVSGGSYLSESQQVGVERSEEKHARSDAQYVVGVFDVFTDAADGSVSIVQELMSGGSLQDMLDNYKAGLAETVSS